MIFSNKTETSIIFHFQWFFLANDHLLENTNLWWLPLHFPVQIYWAPLLYPNYNFGSRHPHENEFVALCRLSERLFTIKIQNTGCFSHRLLRNFPLLKQLVFVFLQVLFKIQKKEWYVSFQWIIIDIMRYPTTSVICVINFEVQIFAPFHFFVFFKEACKSRISLNWCLSNRKVRNFPNKEKKINRFPYARYVQ